MSEYILSVMAADYWNHFFYKRVTYMMGVNLDLIILANISKKYTKYKKLGVAFTSSFKWPYIKYKVRSFTASFAQDENML